MKLELPDRQQKNITVKNDVSPIKRLLTILFGPVVLALGYFKIYISGYDSNAFSLDHILAFSFIASPFAFFISYKLWKGLETEIILTDEAIIRKRANGKELHIRWNEIKKIYIGLNSYTDCINLTFTRKKRCVPFDRNNTIACPAGPIKEENWLWHAANLILKKIDFYKIPIQGKRELLEEITKKSQQITARAS